MPICLPSFAGVAQPASGGAPFNQYSVSLDGTDDYIQLPNGVLTALTGTAYTISMRGINLDIVGNYQEDFYCWQ